MDQPIGQSAATMKPYPRRFSAPKTPNPLFSGRRTARRAHSHKGNKDTPGHKDRANHIRSTANPSRPNLARSRRSRSGSHCGTCRGSHYGTAVEAIMEPAVEATPPQPPCCASAEGPITMAAVSNPAAAKLTELVFMTPPPYDNMDVSHCGSIPAAAHRSFLPSARASSRSRRNTLRSATDISMAPWAPVPPPICATCTLQRRDGRSAWVRDAVI